MKLEIESLESFVQRSKAMARDLDRGIAEPAAGSLSFESMDGLLKVLTPRRWRLLQSLRKRGPTPVRSLAQDLDRDFRSVKADVAVLMDMGLIDRDDQGSVIVPWSRISVDMALEPA